MRVVIKLGGGVITEKSQLCTPNRSAIRSLSEVVKQLQAEGYSVVLVHGAGSFGHLRAKQWQLKKGLLQDHVFDGIVCDECQTQLDAVKLVRQDMLALNAMVVEELRKVGVAVESFPPHKHFKGDDYFFKGDILPFKREPSEPVPVTFGDVVDVDGPRQFGILSGDDLVVRLSKELEATRLVFAVKGVDGRERAEIHIHIVYIP